MFKQMFLKILAITGIVLLCAAAFIVLAVLLILLVPVRYKITADGSGSGIKAAAGAKWLGGLARAKVQSKDFKVTYSVKILFFTILKGEFGKEDKKKKPETFELIIGEDEPPGKDVRTGCSDGLSKEDKPSGRSKKKRVSEPEKTCDQIRSEEPENTRCGRSLFDQAELAVNRIFENAEKFKSRNLKLFKKIKAVFKKIKQIKYIWDAPVTRRAVKSIKIRLSGFLNHIKPKKIKGELTIGFEDPAQTASAYAAAAIISGSLGAELIIKPDFEEKKFEAENLLISGRIFIGYVVILALKLLTDKDVKRVVNYIRRNF